MPAFRHNVSTVAQVQPCRSARAKIAAASERAEGASLAHAAFSSRKHCRLLRFAGSNALVGRLRRRRDGRVVRAARDDSRAQDCAGAVDVRVST